jgi:hypothetical protein
MATVNEYVVMMDFGDRPRQTIQLYEDRNQVGTITLTNPALFHATMHLLRHRQQARWDEDGQRLTFVLEPMGEANS